MRGGVGMLLALAVGLGVGFMLGATRPPTGALRAGPAAPREPAPEIRPSASTSLAQALRELPSPTVERGRGSITGRVARADGTPVEGATVRAMRRREDTRHERGTGPPPPPDIEEEVRKFVEQLQWRQRNQADAVTGADGRYVVTGLADGRYHMAAWREGFQLRPGEGGWEAAPGATVDFTAKPVVEVGFQVLLPDGGVPPEAPVRIRSGNRSSIHDWRREQPSIFVEPGSYACSAWTRDNLYQSPEVRLDLVEGAPAPPNVVLRLEGRAGITGTVTFAPDLPFENASVHALAFTGESAPHPNQLLNQGTRESLSHKPRYGLLDLAPGRYLVGVALERSVVATRIVEV
ncbi:MAG TPA: carboxypeptidase-like regulatory domain-containing protein, partial [Vicinamibacteria bacterium]